MSFLSHHICLILVSNAYLWMTGTLSIFLREQTISSIFLITIHFFNSYGESCINNRQLKISSIQASCWFVGGKTCFQKCHCKIWTPWVHKSKIFYGDVAMEMPNWLSVLFRKPEGPNKHSIQETDLNSNVELCRRYLDFLDWFWTGL